jgi:hypothetical protein
LFSTSLKPALRLLVPHEALNAAFHNHHHLLHLFFFIVTCWLFRT